jgi:DNA helicase-2/ATP-dependent DNA helicase PcrA
LHENGSEAAEEFQLGLRLYANPKDRLHLAALAKKWDHPTPEDRTQQTPRDMLAALDALATKNGGARCKAVVEALKGIDRQSQRLDLMPGLKVLRHYADGLSVDERRAVYEDTAVLEKEWDQYLRSGTPPSRTISGFLSGMALGTTQQIKHDGVALLTVHSAKGLEYDVVFIVCMTEGVFPDYRAKGDSKAMAEEERNAFVAVTRSKRLLYFSYPCQRRMPWGDTWNQQPSRYLRDAGLVG